MKPEIFSRHGYAVTWLALQAQKKIEDLRRTLEYIISLEESATSEEEVDWALAEAAEAARAALNA